MTDGIQFQAVIGDSVTFQKSKFKLVMELNEGLRDEISWLAGKWVDNTIVLFNFQFEDGAEINLEAEILRLKLAKDFGRELALFYDRQQINVFSLFDSFKGKLADIHALIPATYKYGTNKCNDKRWHSEERPTIKSSVSRG